MTKMTETVSKDDVLLGFAVEFEPKTAKKLLKQYLARFPEFEKDLWSVARALMRDAFREREES